MLKNYLTVALRGIRHQKLYAFINVFGLALGMASCIVILAFVRHERSFDAFHDGADTIYRVNIRALTPDGNVKAQAGQPLPLAPALASELPQIRAATRIRSATVLVKTEAVETYEAEALFTDSSFFDVFSFPTLEGPAPFRRPATVAITQTAARKYFPDQDPINQTILFSIGGAFEEFTVATVLEDPPPNSSLSFEVVLPMEWWPTYGDTQSNWSSWGVNTFVRTHGDSPTPAQLDAFAAVHYEPLIRTWQILRWLSEDEDAFHLELQPLTQIHFTPSVELSHTPAVNPDYLYLLLILSAMVLLVACVNFATLAVGRSARRAREVGLRKVLGAHRTQLVGQFMGEAFWMSLAALTLGVLMAEGFLPVLDDLTNRQIDIHYLRDAKALAAVFGLAIATGLIAGFYPALHLSRFNPVEAFKGGRSSYGSSRWVQPLVVAQFACSIFIIAAVLIGSSQLRYIQTKNLGFDDDHVMVVPTHTDETEASEQLVSVLENEFSTLSGVASVTASSSSFNHDLAWNSFNIGETGHTVYLNRVEPGFIETMDMKLLGGRPFSETHPGDAVNSIIVNEKFVRDFELDDPVGRPLTGVTIGRIEDPVIVGVVQDYHFQSLHQSIEPMALFTGSDFAFGYLYVRLGPGSLGQQVEAIEGVWKRVVPDLPFTGYFLDEDIDRLYRTERQWQRLVGWGSIFTLGIACMGLFGLAAFSTERRRKEIGIRKVLGAGSAALAAMLSKEFLRLVVIAFVIAAPLAYILMGRWLDEFAYHVAVRPMDVIAAGAAALIIAVLTVSYQTLRAASADPATTLRRE